MSPNVALTLNPEPECGGSGTLDNYLNRISWGDLQKIRILVKSVVVECCGF